MEVNEAGTMLGRSFAISNKWGREVPGSWHVGPRKVYVLIEGQARKASCTEWKHCQLVFPLDMVIAGNL